jgi:hypothetical protein
VYVHVHGEGRAGRRAKIGLVQSFLAFLICATGGSLINSILLGTPIPGKTWIIFELLCFFSFYAILYYASRIFATLCTNAALEIHFRRDLFSA